MKLTIRLFALSFLAVLLIATPAVAGTDAALFAGYWGGFVDYWKTMFKQQNGVVMGVLGVGAVALFIITRGKWRK